MSKPNSPDSDRDRELYENGDAYELGPLEERLRSDRPHPSAATRSRIRTMIVAAGPLRSRPANLRALVVSCSLAGVALLAVAALGAFGAGPL